MFGACRISVTVSRRRWTGWWLIDQGRLLVCSEIGIRAEPLEAGGDADRRAKALLKEIVRQHLAAAP